MTDIEIQKNAKIKNITDISNDIKIPEEYIETYGKYKAKISNEYYDKIKNNEDGKLILVTSINPTPLGEGKTTVAISLSDALNKEGHKSILALREPSLGPVFGLKGGATGGGYAQVSPMEDINLHFTGDMHAITSANNLLSAAISNHIYWGNELGIDRIVFNRCLDLNDRDLRNVKTYLFNESFSITAASEMMAILCLSSDIKDLKKRISNILIGYNKENKPIYAKDLKIEGSLTVLLKDAIKPNLVQTLENNPALVHGGPFANIAHGCNSIIATKMALKMGKYVVTEAGFGSDLGAEKFFDIKCRTASIKPDVVVLVATLKAIKYHGGCSIEDVKNKSIDYIKKGIGNLYKHINNIKNNFGLNLIVAINKYDTDYQEELEYLKKELESKNISVCISDGYKNGSNGSIILANKVVEMSKLENNFKYVYDINDDIKTKIEKVCKMVYGANNIIYSEKALENIKQIENNGYISLPVCISKTPYSFTGDAKKLDVLSSFDIEIKNIELKSGAGFVVAYVGDIITMPGLPKKPAALNIDIDENNNIIGIF